MINCYDIFTFGNSKVGPDVLCFNLPPLVTCTPSEWCRKKCYARTGWFQLSNVKNSLKRKYHLSQSDDFVSLTIAALRRSDKKYVRIHVAGDFYSNEYVDKWIEIAQANPDTLFKATTKRDDLIDRLIILDSLPNVTIKDSVDFTRKAKNILKSRLVINEAEGGDGLYHCPGYCQPCGYKCWNKSMSVSLKIIGDYYHRRRKL